MFHTDVYRGFQSLSGEYRGHCDHEDPKCNPSFSGRTTCNPSLRGDTLPPPQTDIGTGYRGCTWCSSIGQLNNHKYGLYRGISEEIEEIQQATLSRLKVSLFSNEASFLHPIHDFHNNFKKPKEKKNYPNVPQPFVPERRLGERIQILLELDSEKDNEKIINYLRMKYVIFFQLGKDFDFKLKFSELESKYINVLKERIQNGEKLQTIINSDFIKTLEKDKFVIMDDELKNDVKSYFEYKTK